MLRASSSGIVLLRKCQCLFFFEHPDILQSRHFLADAALTARSSAQRRDFHVQGVMLSRFSTRFGSHLSTLTDGPSAEGSEGVRDGVQEGEKQQRELLPPPPGVGLGLGLDVLGGGAQDLKTRYYYLPWARPPPLPPPAVLTSNTNRRIAARRYEGSTSGVDADMNTTRVGRKSRSGVGKRKKSASSERRHHRVRSAKSHRRKLGEVKEGEKREEEFDVLAGEERDVIGDAILELAESGNSQQVSDEQEQKQEDFSANVPQQLQLEGELHVDDLSAEQLRAIILDKRSDLMGLTWDAYHRLVTLDADLIHDRLSREDEPKENTTPVSLITPNLLIRLANRLIAQRKYHQKNSREIFLRLLSVYARLRKERARDDFGLPYLRTPEWNCLIHFAGTGLRGKASLQAYNASLDVFADMLRGVEDARATGREGSFLKEIEPDIYTYTSLLNIALRTEHQPAIEHAMNLLRDSGKEPTRITHLCMINFRFKYDGLLGVRDLLASLKPEDIGADGVTAYMACAGNSGDLDTVRNIYDALRKNLEAYEDGTYGPPSRPLNKQQRSEDNSISGRPVSSTDDAIADDEKYMLVEGIRLPRSLVPSASIYHYTIQIFAYYGRLSDALQVFMDMLATHESAGGGIGPRRVSPQFFQPSYEVFRGLFLGFARHGKSLPPSSASPSTSNPTELPPRIPEWNWDRFSVIFDSFIEYADSIRPPSERTVYWIMSAVRRMTNDERLLQDVWRRLNERWHIRKRGRLKAMDVKYGHRDAAQSEEK